ncbi:MAG TPA: hypothetical protein VKZ93_05155, partial [Arenibacter sp.]|nr:hypothetical protein [Arenibacter sp.]
VPDIQKTCGKDPSDFCLLQGKSHLPLKGKERRFCHLSYWKHGSKILPLGEGSPPPERGPGRKRTARA